MTATERTLSDVRLEMFLKDYELSIGIIERHSDAIETLRKWELTLLPVLLGFGLSMGLEKKLVLLAIPVVCLFALLELMSRADLSQVAMRVGDLELSLQKAEELEQLLQKHSFIITWDAQRTTRGGVRTATHVLRSENFLVWNGGMAFLLIMVFLLL